MTPSRICPVHGTLALARVEAPGRGGRVAEGFGKVTKRIAEGNESNVADGFIGPMDELSRAISEADLTSAIASGNPDVVQAAARTGSVKPLFENDPDLFQSLLSTGRASGEGTAVITSETVGAEFTFNATDPNTVTGARTQTADLVRHIEEEAKEAVRIITATGAEFGLTPAKQAGAVKDFIGLPSNWADAPLRFGEELRSGTVNAGRLLHDPFIGLPRSQRAMKRRVVTEIRAKIEAGTLTEADIQKYVRDYARNLLHRRALNIARTETMRAANAGQLESWKQATNEGVLPRTARRVVIVTPDERLRQTHLETARMNQDGVRMDEPFDTLFGRLMYPPWEVLCRCTVGLIFLGT